MQDRPQNIGLVQCFSALKKAMSEGWQLHAEMGRNPDGTGSASRSFYVLVKDGRRRTVTRKTAIGAIRARIIISNGPLLENGTSVFRLRQST